MKAESDTSTRVTGVILFLIGLGLGYWQIYLPILQAVRGEPHISYSSEAVAVAPLGMILGFFLTMFGAKGLDLLQKRPSKTMTLVILILILVCTLGCILGMDFLMKSLGYS